MEGDLPTSDRWEIELHVPDIRGAPSIGHRKRRMMATSRIYFKGSFDGAYELTIANGSREETIEFEVVDSDYGWLSIGSTELAAGSIDVTITPKSGTEQLFFDALRFVHPDED